MLTSLYLILLRKPTQKVIIRRETKKTSDFPSSAGHKGTSGKKKGLF